MLEKVGFCFEKESNNLFLKNFICLLESNFHYLSQMLYKNGSSHFIYQDGMRIFRTDEISSEAARSINSLLDLNFNGNGTLVKSSRSRTVFNVSLPQKNSEDRKIFIKKYMVKNRLKGFLNLFAPSKAWREMYLIRKLIDSGIPTTIPLLVVEKRHNSMLKESYLITEEVQNSQNFLSFIKQNFLQKEKKELLLKLAEFVSWIHDKGFFHSDLTLKNILVHSSNGEDKSLLIMDIDNSIFTKGKISIWKRAENLLQLSRFMSNEHSFTEDDRNFFIHNYCLISDSLSVEKILKKIEKVKIYRKIYRKNKNYFCENPMVCSKSIISFDILNFIFKLFKN